MYCANCGVQLADSEQRCPLCQTRAFHPDLTRENGEPLFPETIYTLNPIGTKLPQIIVTAVWLLPVLVVLLCDWQFNQAVTWSGYVVGALLLSYVSLVLPFWFKQPNPVIFVPCDFAAIAVYLLYIDLMTAGGWFLSFGLPVVAGLSLIVTAVITLLRYVKRGRLYTVGGAVLTLAGFIPVVEMLVCRTFESVEFIGWSLYPLVVLGLLGGLLIFLAISRPARETMERKFFF